MTILLLSTYEMGHQPINLGWPLAALAAAGIQAVSADLSVDDFPSDIAAAADLVAISVPMHTALRLGVETAQKVRALNPNSHICFYGHYAHLNGAYLVKSGLANTVLAGEFEPELVRIADGLAKLEPAQSIVPLKRIDYPVPLRSGLANLEVYAGLDIGSEVRLAGYTEATRGCLHTCTHCPIVPVYNGRFFAIPPETVLADVRQQVDAGAEHITFGDPDFLNGPTHAFRIARSLHREFPHLTFDFTAKVEHLLRLSQHLPELVDLGAVFAVSAFESTSERVLQMLNKGHTASDMERVLDIAAAAGLPIQPTWVAFTPWTTMDDYLKMLGWIYDQHMIGNVPAIQYAVRLLVPPRSALLSTPAASDFGPLDPENFVHPWNHPDPCMDELHQRVSHLVEHLDAGSPYVYFREIETLAYTIAEKPLPVRIYAADMPVSPPRLTEDWFC